MIATTKKALDGNVGLVKRWKGTKGGTDRVQAWLSLRQIMTCTPALIEAMGEAAPRARRENPYPSLRGVYEIDYSWPSLASVRPSTCTAWARSTATCIAPIRSCSRKPRWTST